MNIDKTTKLLPIVSNLQKCIYLNEINKTDEINKTNIILFKKIFEDTDNFGNKHLLIFIANYILKHNYNNYNELLNNKNEIIHNYLNSLYFLKFFSQKIKTECLYKFQKQFTSYIEIKFNEYNNNNKMNLSFVDTFINFILNAKYLSEIQLFKFNNLFMNIVIQMIKIFNLKKSVNILSSKFMSFLLKNTVYYPDEIKYPDIVENFNIYYDFFNEQNTVHQSEFINVTQTDLHNLFLEIKQNIYLY
jgi:hypothetical protein